MYTHFFTRLSSLSQKKSLRFLHKLLFFSYCLIFKVLSAALLRQLFNYITHISICQQLFYSFYQVFSNFFVCFATLSRTAHLLYHTFTVCQLLFYSFFVFFLILCVRSLERFCIIYLSYPFVNCFFLNTAVYTKRVASQPFPMRIVNSL